MVCVDEWGPHGKRGPRNFIVLHPEGDGRSVLEASAEQFENLADRILRRQRPLLLLSNALDADRSGLIGASTGNASSQSFPRSFV
jgi:hypothetical protein